MYEAAPPPHSLTSESDDVGVTERLEDLRLLIEALRDEALGLDDRLRALQAALELLDCPGRPGAAAGAGGPEEEKEDDCEEDSEY